MPITFFVQNNRLERVVMLHVVSRGNERIGSRIVLAVVAKILSLPELVTFYLRIAGTGNHVRMYGRTTLAQRPPLRRFSPPNYFTPPSFL